MGGKAKPTHHTAKEIKAKGDLHKPRGGGQAGQQERKPMIAMTCVICKQSIASQNALRQHYESKHPKNTIDEPEYARQLEAAKSQAGSVAGPKKYAFTGKQGPSTL
jgi:hypothetical protein